MSDTPRTDEFIDVRPDDRVNFERLFNVARDLELRLTDGTPKWIPVSERMPTSGQLIAIRYAPDADVYDALRWLGEVDLGYFALWMPLPEPQK